METETVQWTGRVARAPAAATVVVMAASSGGLAALSRVLGGLPADFPLPIGIVQHRSDALPNLLPQLLSRAGPLPAKLAEEGEVMRPGMVYLAPPDRHLVMRPDRSVAFMDGGRIRYVRSSANPLFESAAEGLDGGVIGVVLTGYGADGTDGVQAIRAAGGIVIAQDPATAAQGEMPASAIRTGMVDYVVPLEQIAPLLVRLARGARPDEGPVCVAPAASLDESGAPLPTRPPHDP